MTGKISFPKHISQGRRLLRNSLRQLGAPAVGMRRARLRCQGARRAQHQPGHKSQAVPGTAGTGMLRENSVLPRAPKQERKSPGRALMGAGSEQLRALSHRGQRYRGWIVPLVVLF